MAIKTTLEAKYVLMNDLRALLEKEFPGQHQVEAIFFTYPETVARLTP
jgi:hypothetical protein